MGIRKASQGIYFQAKAQGRVVFSWVRSDGGASPQRAQHAQRTRGGRSSGNPRRKQQLLSRGGTSAAPASPLVPTAALPPQGPPRRSQPRPARSTVARPAGWGRLMGCPARVPGVVPSPRANVRSPRPPAAGAPAPTPGADRYASGGEAAGSAPLPRAPLAVVPGPPALGVGARAAGRGEGATRGGTFGPRLPGSSPPLSARPDSLSLLCLCLSASVSLPFWFSFLLHLYFSVSPCPGLGGTAQPPQAFVHQPGA